MIRLFTRLGQSGCQNRLANHLLGLAGIVMACLFLLGCNDDPETGKPGDPKTISEVAKVEKKGTNEPEIGTAPISKESEEKAKKPVKQSAQEPADDFIDDSPAVNDAEFHKGLIEAADSYLKYVMVNAVALEAPADCKPPADDFGPLMSNSKHDSTHGRKLYFLFAKDITHYLSLDGTPAPEGQTVVKESWSSKPANPEARNLRNHASGVRITPRATVGDEVVEIGKRTDLFVMMKLDPENENTDNGWVYGVLDPNTKEVKAAGKVASCMRCHEDAKNDRLFGPTLGN